MLDTAATARTLPDRPQVVVQRPGDGEHVWFLDTLVTVKVRGAGTGAAWGVMESVMPAGHRTPFHRHADEDEAWYVLDGVLSVFLGQGQRIEAGPGAFVHVPRGVAHGLRAEQQVRVLILSAPDGFVEFAREVGTAAPGAELPPPREPDKARLMALGDKHRIEILGPLPE